MIQARSALLSNFEVRNLLLELENDYISRSKTAIRIKKEEEMNGEPPRPNGSSVVEISENLRTIEVEVRKRLGQLHRKAQTYPQAIQYLSADFQPTASQTEEGIAQLVKGLSTYDLTKAEKLQVVNLAPTVPVELYAVRFTCFFNGLFQLNFSLVRLWKS